MALAHSPDRPNPAVLAFLDAAGRPGVELAVSGRDEMLGHLLAAHHGSVDAALVGYFRTGRMAAAALERVLRWRFGEGFGERPLRLLELASGHGRVTRFLRASLPAAELTVAEIDAEAVAFQRETFGVAGVVTGADPDSLPDGDRFDAVFVASFFSHLPEGRLAPWLGALYRRLAPGGVLVASTHGAETLPPGRTLPPGGLYFEEVSESRRLETAEYGSTWVAEEYVGRRIAEVSGGAASFRRFPRALWHSQDLYVIVPERNAELASLDLRAGVQGYLDACYLEDPETLVIAGWAAERDDPGRRLRVAASVGGIRLGETTPSSPRSDARELVGAACERAGFELRLRAPAGFASGDLAVVSVDSIGSDRAADPEPATEMIHAATLEVGNLYLELGRTKTARERLRHERDVARAEIDSLRARAGELDAAVHRLGWRNHVLESELAAIRRSRFWRLRDAWFRVTGRRAEG